MLIYILNPMVVQEVLGLFSMVYMFIVFRFRNSAHARVALEKMNGFVLAGKAVIFSSK
jgi:hypothetical protein